MGSHAPVRDSDCSAGVCLSLNGEVTMFVHDVEPLLVIVAALIKLCQYFFHVTPRFLSRWKRRLMRSRRSSRSAPPRARPRPQPLPVRANQPPLP